jgi:Domain of unknown function (DUF3523)
MSWLFGYKSQQPQIPEGMQDPNAAAGQPGAGGPAGDVQLTKAEKKAMEAYRFDSTALERAAEAAKTLERSSKFFFSLSRPITSEFRMRADKNSCLCFRTRQRCTGAVENARGQPPAGICGQGQGV